MYNVSEVFSSTDIFGIFLNSTNTNLTGDWSLTFGVAILFLLLLMSVFKLPELLIVLLISAPVILLSSIQTVSADFNMFVGVIILYLAFLIWSMFPGK